MAGLLPDTARYGIGDVFSGHGEEKKMKTGLFLKRSGQELPFVVFWFCFCPPPKHFQTVGKKKSPIQKKKRLALP
jgi:hypothetical protein